MSLPEIDKSIFFFINRDLENYFFDIVIPFITKKAYVVFLPFCLWLFFKDRKKTFIVLVLSLTSLLFADWFSNEIKHWIGRVRPCNVLEGVRTLVNCGRSYSMTSNHAANAFAFAMPFYIMFKNRIRYVFPVIALLVGFSRVYVGVHYPFDVIVGALLGMFLALCIIKLYNKSSETFKVTPHITILSVALLLLSIFRIYYILHGPLNLSPDEAHYWEWSRRLDLSYYSKGPMIAYLIYAGTSLFGDTVFGIRIMAVIFSLLSSIFLYLFGKELYGKTVGVSSALLIQVIPLFSTFGIIFTIDSPFIFFWVLSLFLFWKAITSQRPGTNNGIKKQSQISNLKSQIYWCLLGLSLGLGLLTKYTMSFFYPCALLFLLLFKDNRRILTTKIPYFAFLISLMVFSPVIIWNANHNWVTLKHTAGQAHLAEGLQISLKSFFEFLGSQLGVITPLLFILMAVSVWKLRKTREGAFLFWFSIPVIVFFLLKSIQAKVQANWALPGYLTGIVAFSAFYIKRFYSEDKFKKILISAGVILSIITTSIAHYPSILHLKPKQDPTSRLRGWEELGEEVTNIYEKMSVNRPVFIFSDRYQVSSELAFYVKGHPVTYCINLGRRMDQYDLWPGFYNLIHYDAIFIRSGDNKIPEKLSAAFRKVEKRVFKVYTKKQIEIRDCSIFMCYDFHGLKEEKPESY